MTDSRFVYVTYINATPEKVWEALTTPEFMRQYFFGSAFNTDWKVGSPWTLDKPGGDGGVADSGEVLEVDAPRRLVLSWRSEWMPEAHAEGHGRMVAEIEPSGDAAKLTITHSISVPNSKLIGAVSGGWPKILSNLKSLLETGSIVGGLVMKAELDKV